MRYIKTYEDRYDDYQKPEFTKSSYTFEEEATSRIDSSKKVVIKTWMKCPICSEKIKDMNHGEIQTCPKCRTTMQVFGNALHTSNITSTNFRMNDKELVDVEYTAFYTKEDLVYSDYHRGNQITCPLCNEILDEVDHGETKICPTCSLKMTRWGNSLECEIRNKDLKLYADVKKYNL